MHNISVPEITSKYLFNAWGRQTKMLPFFHKETQAFLKGVGLLKTGMLKEIKEMEGTDAICDHYSADTKYLSCNRCFSAQSA